MLPLSVLIPLIVIIIIWITVAIAGATFLFLIERDAQQDIEARKNLGINGGREALAKLNVLVARCIGMAFLLWTICGLYAISPWSLMQTGPPWRRWIVPICLLLAESLVFYAMFCFQRVRKAVLHEDKRQQALKDKAERDVQTILDREARKPL